MMWRGWVGGSLLVMVLACGDASLESESFEAEQVSSTLTVVPTGLTPDNAHVLPGDSIALSWGHVSGAASYQLAMEYDSGEERWRGYHTWTVRGRSTFSVWPQVDDARYRWRVRACNGAGCSSWSAQASFVCGQAPEDPPETPPEPPEMPEDPPETPEDPPVTPTEPSLPGEGTACSVRADAGTCLRVSSCAGQSTPGHCPGPSEVQCCTTPDTPSPTPAGACDPNAAPTPNAGLTEGPGSGGCPDGMVRVAGFCVDRYEATLEVAATGQSWSPYLNPGSTPVIARSIAGAVPQGYISGDQAEAACQRAGKRLCSSQEWLRACQGSATTTYPYGDTRRDGVCNDARARHPVVEYYGTSADWIWSKLGHRCINQVPDGLARTGEHAGCVTQDGAFDMMGNVHEWVADASGTFRGGFYVDTVRNRPGCLYRTTAHTRPHWDYSTGFRCCADAP